MAAHDRASKSTRAYTLRRRAERQAETRQRIVEAAMALHGSVGPAQTTISMVAERAGVQRHTLYAHFPDEISLLLACSAHHLEADPPPDATPWRCIPDRRERLATGLGAVYGWYERNAALLACVTRDAEHHAPTREVVELRFGPFLVGWLDVLGADMSVTQHAMLRLALSYSAWRTLVRDAGLQQAAAVAAMVQAVASAERSRSAGAPTVLDPADRAPSEISIT